MPARAASYGGVFQAEEKDTDRVRDNCYCMARQERSSSDARQEIADGIRSSLEKTAKQQDLLAQQLNNLDSAMTRLKCISHDRPKSQDFSALGLRPLTSSSPRRDQSFQLSPEQLDLITAAPLSPIEQESFGDGFPIGSRHLVGRLRAARRQNSYATPDRKSAVRKTPQFMRTSKSSPAISCSFSPTDLSSWSSEEDEVDGLEITDPEMLDLRIWISMQSHTWC